MCLAMQFLNWNDMYFHQEVLKGKALVTLVTSLKPQTGVTFTFSHLADAFVQSDVQGREQSS